MSEFDLNNEVLHTLNPTQNKFFIKNVQNNIYKLHASYKLLMKKHSELCAQPTSIGTHEQLQIETATESIIIHAQLLLDQIHEMKIHLLMLYQSHDPATPLSVLKARQQAREQHKIEEKK